MDIELTITKPNEKSNIYQLRLKTEYRDFDINSDIDNGGYSLLYRKYKSVTWKDYGVIYESKDIFSIYGFKKLVEDHTIPLGEFKPISVTKKDL
jgi:hypothetical protein